ncbi:MAG: outer membrane protein transport protein, partial [Gemmatimonadales bacterium]
MTLPRPPGNPLGAPGGMPLDAALATLNLFGENRPLADQTATASITMPMQLVAGVAFDVTSSLTLMADYQLSGWSVVDTIIGEFAQPDSITPDLVLVDNYNDTHAFRGGFEYQASDALTVRAGSLWHTEAAPPESV